MLSPQPPVDRTALEKIIKQERLVTIGRIISSFVHEINNPLQAIRGALALAQDELDNPSGLQEDITISQQEIEHISAILNQVRLIYRSQSDQPELFPLVVPFRDAIELTREEAMRQKVRVQNLLPAQSPLVEAVYNHIYIVILRTILAFIDAISAAGGGELAITSEDTTDPMKLYFTTRAPISIPASDPHTAVSAQLLDQFDLASASELVKANGGFMELKSDEAALILQINFPNVS
jgi:signal transduction histidine kinase